jgi:hypothetical protein
VSAVASIVLLAGLWWPFHSKVQGGRPRKPSDERAKALPLSQAVLNSDANRLLAHAASRRLKTGSSTWVMWRGRTSRARWTSW